MKHDENMRANWIALCIAIHIVIDFMAVRGALSSMMAVSIVMGQLSLVAIWAGVSRIPFFVRFALVIVATVVCWCLSTYFSGYSAKGPLGANWAIAFLVQAGVLYAIVRGYVSLRAAKASGQPIRTAFNTDLLGLLKWTTCAAIVFGIYQFARSKLEWTGILESWASAVPFIGVIFAITAAVCAWPFAEHEKRIIVFIKAFAALVVIALVSTFIIRRTLDDFAARETRYALIGQVATIFASLVLVTPINYRTTK